MFTSMDKALTALVGSLAFIGQATGVYTMSPNVQGLVAGLIPVLVYLIPNKKAA